MGDFSHQLEEFAMENKNQRFNCMNPVEKNNHLHEVSQIIRQKIKLDGIIDDRFLLDKLGEAVRCCSDPMECDELNAVDPDLYHVLIKFRDLDEPKEMYFRSFLHSHALLHNPSGHCLLESFNREKIIIQILRDVIVVNNKVNLPAKFYEGNNFLHWCIIDNDIKLLNICVVNGMDINLSNQNNLPPLHIAIISQSTECLSYLLEHQVDCRQTDNAGNTALHLIAHNRPDYLELLLNHCLLDAKNSTGDTPLHIAITSRQFNTAQILLETGADPEIKNNSGGSARDVFRKTLFIPEEFQKII